MPTEFVFKVSKEGKDISSTNPEDFVFHSDYASVKIAQEPPNRTAQTVTVNGSSTATVTIAHNLGFIPLFMVFTEVNPSSGKYYCGASIAAPDDAPVNTVFLNTIGGGTYADSTNVVLVFQNNTAVNKTIHYYYYIFGDAGA